MLEIAIDCRCIHSRESLHRAFAEAFSFPAWYGNNLDALHDCLTALPQDTHLTLTGVSALLESLGGYANALLSLLRDTVEETPRLHINLED